MSKLGKNKINLGDIKDNLIPLSINKSFFINSQGILIQKLNFTGPLGTQSMIIPDLFNIEITKTYILFLPLNINDNLRIDPQSPSLWGTTHSLIQQLIQGVTKGFVKQIQLIGIGYKA
jgi:ribosomal protein L6P/L9E